MTALRAEPSQKAEQTSQVLFGETVRVLRDEGVFSEVLSPDNYRGWMLRRHLAVLETGEHYPDPVRAAMVASLFVPVYHEPMPQSERRTMLTLGTVVELAVGDTRDAYYPLRVPNGEIGYIESHSLIVPQYPARQHFGVNAAIIARGMIGVPYLWGGRTPFGIDCSGFIQRIFWLCGIILPRDAYLQADWEEFVPVQQSDLLTGDLVFFGGNQNPHGRSITHVGMVYETKEKSVRLIHAAGQHGVIIETLDTVLRDRDYRCARRLNVSGAA